MEIQENSIKNGSRVLIVNDLLATGGTLSKVCTLIKSCGGVVGWIIVEHAALNGGYKVKANVESLITMENAL